MDEFDHKRMCRVGSDFGRGEILERGVESWAEIWYNMGHEDKEEVKYGHCPVGRAVDGD